MVNAIILVIGLYNQDIILFLFLFIFVNASNRIIRINILSLETGASLKIRLASFQSFTTLFNFMLRWSGLILVEMCTVPASYIFIKPRPLNNNNYILKRRSVTNLSLKLLVYPRRHIGPCFKQAFCLWDWISVDLITRYGTKLRPAKPSLITGCKDNRDKKPFQSFHVIWLVRPFINT